MTPISLHALGPVLEVLPVAFVFSSQLLLTDRSSAKVESGLSEKKSGLLLVRTTGLTAILGKLPDPGWSHYGIND
jgi:hypothetical protein